jgi:hypothetical protein
MENVGRIYIDGKPWGEDKPYAIQQQKIKQLVANGIPRKRIELHKPIHRGVVYCKLCGAMTVNPTTQVYGTAEYWKCKCSQINYIR